MRNQNNILRKSRLKRNFYLSGITVVYAQYMRKPRHSRLVYGIAYRRGVIGECGLALNDDLAVSVDGAAVSLEQSLLKIGRRCKCRRHNIPRGGHMRVGAQSKRRQMHCSQ